MTAPPRLSIRLHGGLPPGRCVELARAAEEAGFASVWFAENPFQRGALPAASACAAATRSIRIGLGVVNPFNRHPTLIAMEIGALDELAQGRAVLGIGAGIAEAVRRMGFDYDRPLGAVRDAITIVRGLLAGGTVDHTGKVFSALGVTLDYAPPRPDMPILMAARGDQSLALCGEIADGLMISNMCPPAFTARAAAIVHDAARAAGRPPPPEIVQYVPCCVRADRAEAVGFAKQALGDMLPAFWELGARLPSARTAMLCDGGLDEAGLAAAVKRLQAGEPAADVLDDRVVAAFALAGTAEDCLAQAAIYAKAGVTDLALTLLGPRPEAGIADLGNASGTGARHMV